jgi:hypothetical protein
LSLKSCFVSKVPNFFFLKGFYLCLYLKNIFDLDLNPGFKSNYAAKELQNNLYFPGQPKNVFSPIHCPARQPLAGPDLLNLFMFFTAGPLAFGPSDLASPLAAHFPLSSSSRQAALPPSCASGQPPPRRTAPVSLLCNEEASRPTALCLPWKRPSN